MTTPKQTPISSGELMIGNWVEVDSNYEQVKSISDPWIETTTFHMIHDFRGIPLTPEILKSVGAKPLPYPGQWDYEIPVGAIKFYFRFNADRCYSEFGGIYFGDHFKYLHQIQNMVSLAGSHLKVEL